ncbi:glycosyltransferase family 2 protein [Geobacillus sp. BK01]|uniref:glycosyltransferase family 2 protein n=1 Tax=Geobacillus sp. BK01 TaxID=3457328 RepID=UPI003FA5A995
MLVLPKVSIIIPAYNVGNYIERCLTSIVNQSLKDIEIIVVNDGSNDNTLEVTRKFADIDNRIKVINSENKGVSAARNSGLLQSTGKYIYQIDADDWIEQNALEEMYEAAENNRADIVITNAYIDYDNGTLLPFIDGRLINEEPIKDFFLGNIKASVWTKLYRRDLFTKYNIGYVEGIRVGEDLLINFFLMLQAKKVIKIEKSFLHYIQRENSAMHSYKSSMYDIYKVFDEIESFMKRSNLYRKYKDEFLYLKYMHTYYFRVISSVSLSSIHREFYRKWRKERDRYLGNRYILEFLKEQSHVNRLLNELYTINYFLGLALGVVKVSVKQLKGLLWGHTV